MTLQRRQFLTGALAAATTTVLSAPVTAQSRYLQCVPYARQQSGVEIYGNAHTWWSKAAGKYARGSRPAPGAVMVLKPHGKMRLGHVAYVSEVIDSRHIRLNHANWSRINGRRGQMERDVPAYDVSPNNDWSQVRVWYHSIQDLGRTSYPLYGFIYNSPTAHAVPASAQPQQARAESSRAFKDAFGRGI